MRAWLNLRFTVPERRAVFRAGLEAIGFEVCEGLTRAPATTDMLVTWNRIHEGDEAAKLFEARGLPVIVAENATWGNEFTGRHWYTLARNFHNVAGRFPVGGPERWDSLGGELEAWRTGGETVVLPSRGFGPAPYRMPANWSGMQQGRIRAHPGRSSGKPLRDDLAQCGRVVTWGSAAAVKALMWGIPVTSHQPQWIAAQDNTDGGRLAMLRRIAWAQWEMHEIASGEPFARLIDFTGKGEK